MNKELNEAAEKYAMKNAINGIDAKFVRRDFKAGAQWQLEQKQVVSDEQLEVIADKFADDNSDDENISKHSIFNHVFEAYKAGFKSALRYSAGGFSEELEADFKLLYKKINTLAIEVDGSIVSNIKETVNKIYNHFHHL